MKLLPAASSPTVDLEARAGVAFPAADFMEFTDAGLGIGVGGALWIHDDVALRAYGNINNLNGERAGLVSEAATPDMSLYHYGVGIEVDVPGRMSPSPWDFEVNAGVGRTLLDTEAFIDGPEWREDITHTYPNVNAGLPTRLTRRSGQSTLARAYVGTPATDRLRGGWP